MPSHRQTLSEYIQRHNDLRNSKKQLSEIIVSPRNNKRTSQIVIEKKKKISFLMSSILHQVKNDDPKEQHFAKIENIINRASQQFRNDMDQIQQYYQQRCSTQTDTNKQQQPYIITVNNLKYEPTQENRDTNILRQVKSNRKQKVRQAEISFKCDKKDISRSKISNPLLKQRSHKSKQNSPIIERSNGNPQQDFDYSINQDVLNKAFDKKQSKLESQKSKIILRNK